MSRALVNLTSCRRGNSLCWESMATRRQGTYNLPNSLMDTAARPGGVCSGFCWSGKAHAQNPKGLLASLWPPDARNWGVRDFSRASLTCSLTMRWPSLVYHSRIVTSLKDSCPGAHETSFFLLLRQPKICFGIRLCQCYTRTSSMLAAIAPACWTKQFTLRRL
ncbi:hypothetical protein PV05_05834 [Exophiala xenobiotica]|uniref:Uncharacterized protein n=1 Tax=Exophiala xenobiotica TaxID=348802 RepID=A0A0D2EP23_9EURO|nr:uncharacterized protein PV05_05834 [Exophiala xenobiotica]KIW57258.1 hypothetical protein PV05_05834 [Exophiala xenobiotica]